MGHILCIVETTEHDEGMMHDMSKKLLLAGIMAGIMAMGAVPALAATHDAGTHRIQQQTNHDSNGHHQGQPPQMQNGEQPPEPPKDENGNPLPPPDGKGRQGQNDEDRSGSQPPEPPKDENGNPLPPPSDGSRHGHQQHQQNGRANQSAFL